MCSGGISRRFSAVGQNSTMPNSSGIKFIGVTSVQIYIEANVSLCKLISRQRKKINTTNAVFVEAFKNSRLADCVFQPARC